MKKSIPKPANWQDFESLCKMLWGEIWKISDKIKKNGRLGQPQAGVDVYGIPKGALKYRGIQCKGKDDYTNAELTVKEINKEVEKAKLFNPVLETFIIATTANKNSAIEEYIRLRDIENRENGGFEILLFCWEDIADLIEVNRETFNYYVTNNQFLVQQDVVISFGNRKNKFTISPEFRRITRKYKIKQSGVLHGPLDFSNGIFAKLKMGKSNCSWDTFEIIIQNDGTEALDDYKLYIYPEESKTRGLTAFLGSPLTHIFEMQHSSVYVNKEEKYALYKPKDNSPLLPKENRSFDLHILTLRKKNKIKLKYELFSRNYHKDGEIILNVDPKFEEKEEIIWVESQLELKESKIFRKDRIEETTSMF